MLPVAPVTDPMADPGELKAVWASKGCTGEGHAAAVRVVALRLLLAVVSSLFSMFTRDCRTSWDRSRREMASWARREDAVLVECMEFADMGVNDDTVEPPPPPSDVQEMAPAPAPAPAVAGAPRPPTLPLVFSPSAVVMWAGRGRDTEEEKEEVEPEVETPPGVGL
jgi:hypothetical protein